MKEIPLTQGLVALVDDADYDRLSRHKWYAQSCRDKTFYARTNITSYRGDGTRRQTGFQMHRLLLVAPVGFVVDHIDGNGLNNTRTNLRVVPMAANRANSRKHKGKSKYKGVTADSRGNAYWNASIRVNKKLHWLGRFKSEEEAARAYDAAAVKFHGEFARTNFIGAHCLHPNKAEAA